MSTYILHIETAPLPMEQLIKKAPEFKASAVLKDPVKIADDIEKKKKKYFEEARFHEATSYVCAYALWDTEQGAPSIAEGDAAPEDEKRLLSYLYGKFSAGVGASVVTFGGSKYELPYICRRAAQYGEMDFFHLFYDGWTGEAKKRHMDLAQKWACEGYFPDTIKEITDVIGVNYTVSDTPYYQLAVEDQTTRLVDEIETLYAVYSLLK